MIEVFLALPLEFLEDCLTWLDDLGEWSEVEYIDSLEDMSEEEQHIYRRCYKMWLAHRESIMLRVFFDENDELIAARFRLVWA